MVITLDPKLEAALTEAARRTGTTAEALALTVLRARYLPPAVPEPRDEWERRLLALARDCGTSLSNEAVSSEGIYD